MARLDNYLKAAFARRASDLHFASGEPTRVRVDGELIELETGALESREIQEIFFEILSDAERQKFLATKNLDKSYASQTVGNFRVNIFNTRRGISAVLRAIPSKTPTLEYLMLPPVVGTLCDMDKGLILVTGPTGSGKSTTLAAMINYINETYKSHILTVEDPVEFVHESKKSLINQREIGSSCLSFNDALKYALREDPDVILIGEMRDLETISLALTAAETGHLVFGTLHTRGAGASVDRIIDSFPANQQAMIRTMLAESLRAVISQTLVKKASGEGRVAAYEIMVVNHAISNLIREGKTFQIGSIMQTGRKEGMVLMDQSFLDLVNGKIVSPEEVAMYMENPSVLGGKFAHPNLKSFGSEKKSAGEKKETTNSSSAPKPAPIQTANPTTKSISPETVETAMSKSAPTVVPKFSVPPVVPAAAVAKGAPPMPPPGAPPQLRTAPSPVAGSKLPPIPVKSKTFAPLKVSDDPSDLEADPKPVVINTPPPVAPRTKAAPPAPSPQKPAEVKVAENSIADSAPIEEIQFDMSAMDEASDPPTGQTQELNVELKKFLGEDINAELADDEIILSPDPKRKIG